MPSRKMVERVMMLSVMPKPMLMKTDQQEIQLLWKAVAAEAVVAALAMVLTEEAAEVAEAVTEVAAAVVTEVAAAVVTEVEEEVEEIIKLERNVLLVPGDLRSKEVPVVGLRRDVIVEEQTDRHKSLRSISIY